MGYLLRGWRFRTQDNAHPNRFGLFVNDWGFLVRSEIGYGRGIGCFQHGEPPVSLDEKRCSLCSRKRFDCGYVHFSGILVSATYQEFKMEMRACRHAGRPHCSDDFSLANPLAVAHMNPVEVGILGHVWTGVVNANEVSVAAFGARILNDPGANSPDGGPCWGTVVYAEMGTCPLEDWVETLSIEAGGDA